jgi:hypothetical protein
MSPRQRRLVLYLSLLPLLTFVCIETFPNVQTASITISTEDGIHICDGSKIAIHVFETVFFPLIFIGSFDYYFLVPAHHSMWILILARIVVGSFIRHF